jgi:hypothetical protein
MPASRSADVPAPLPAVVSVHDVMPETLDEVGQVLDLCARAGVRETTLLVVPGRAWGAPQLRRLAAWAEAGHRLAAHGWRHAVDRYGGLYHRLHGALISRRVAEHLALDEAGIAALMARSHAWFVAHDLPSPTLYVPPAWALGRVSRGTLAGLPFRQVEVLRGVHDLAGGRLVPLPLVGFEADTRLRAAFLGPWNRAQARMARARGRPLRIGIHPGDPGLRLAGQLRALLAGGVRPVDYPEAIALSQPSS